MDRDKGSKELDPKKVVGLKIREARKEMGLTQTQFGAMSHYDKAYICRIEKGSMSLNIEKLVTFSKYLKKPVYYFLSDFDEKNEN